MIRSGLVFSFILVFGLYVLGCGSSGGNKSAPIGTGFQITTPSLSNTSVGATVSQSLTTANGQAPFTWAVIAGSPPTGVVLGMSDGFLSGTVTGSGNFNFTVRVTDGNGAQAEHAYTWASTAPPVEWNAGFFFNTGMVGQAYATNLNQGVTGGTQPRTFAVASGTLPAGLTLTSDGVLSGTPTTAGTQAVVVSVTSAPDPATGGASQAQFGGDITIN